MSMHPIVRGAGPRLSCPPRGALRSCCVLLRALAVLLVFAPSPGRCQVKATGAPNQARPFAGPSNAVLHLDGVTGYVDLPPKLLTGLDEITVEGWVRWD